MRQLLDGSFCITLIKAPCTGEPGASMDALLQCAFRASHAAINQADFDKTRAQEALDPK